MLVLSTLFDDLRAVPPLRGQHDALPHLRRVARAMALRQVRATTAAEVHGRIVRRVQRKHHHLRALCAAHRLPAPNLVEALPQLDAFLDAPHQPWPRALQPLALACLRWAPKPVQEEVLGTLWKLLLALLLLPAEGRRHGAALPASTLTRHWQRVYSEGEAARHAVLLGTLRYAQRRAARFMGQGLPYADLFQEGALGLWKAIPRYREWYGVPFQSYATHWIMQRITRALANVPQPVRLPVHLHEHRAALLQVLQQAHARQCAPPTDEALLAALGWDDTSALRNRLGYLRSAIRALPLHTALAEVDDDGTPLTLAGALADDGGIGAVEAALDGDLLCRLVAILPSREASIITLRYGLGGAEPHTLEQLGAQMGVTRERVRQLEQRAHEMLRRKLLPARERYLTTTPPRDGGLAAQVMAHVRAHMQLLDTPAQDAAAAAERAFVRANLPRRLPGGRRPT